MKKQFFFLLIVIWIATACEKDVFTSVDALNTEIYKIMKEYYLWYQQLPSVDPTGYSSPEAFLDVLRYKPYDKWSTVLTKEQYHSYEGGEMIGHGFIRGEDADGNVRILLVYPGTRFALQGVKRGWIISKINGVKATLENIPDLLGDAELGITNNFEFIDENKITVNLAFSKELIIQTPVPHYEIISQGDKKIGYMVFQSFIRPAYESFNVVFEFFHTEGIDDLIIDLRYNGGGFINVADTLAGWIIGDQFSNQPFVNMEFNDKHSEYNETMDIPDLSANLNLERIFFIGTGNTASASELLINGMRSYIPTFLAGSTTHGKPVGMSILEFKNYDYVFLPVTFSYSNADHEGDFFEGLEPDLPATDDATRVLGDIEETSLKTILDFIETGTLPSRRIQETKSFVRYPAFEKSFPEFIKAN